MCWDLPHDGFSASCSIVHQHLIHSLELGLSIQYNLFDSPSNSPGFIRFIHLHCHSAFPYQKFRDQLTPTCRYQSSVRKPRIQFNYDLKPARLSSQVGSFYLSLLAARLATPPYSRNIYIRRLYVSSRSLSRTVIRFHVGPVWGNYSSSGYSPIFDIHFGSESQTFRSFTSSTITGGISTIFSHE